MRGMETYTIRQLAAMEGIAVPAPSTVLKWRNDGKAGVVLPAESDIKNGRRAYRTDLLTFQKWRRDVDAAIWGASTPTTNESEAK